MSPCLEQRHKRQKARGGRMGTKGLHSTEKPCKGGSFETLAGGVGTNSRHIWPRPTPAHQAR
eukprot:12914816-Prorocentrum_lima.AAC.1